MEINYRIAYEKVLLLEKEGLIKTTRLGNSRSCEFTYKFADKVFETEYNRKGSFSKIKIFLFCREGLAELQFHLSFYYLVHRQEVLQTSTQTRYFNNKLNEKRSEVLSPFGRKKIHLTAVTYKDFIYMAKSKEFTVVSEAY